MLCGQEDRRGDEDLPHHRARALDRATGLGFRGHDPRARPRRDGPGGPGRRPGAPVRLARPRAQLRSRARARGAGRASVAGQRAMSAVPQPFAGAMAPAHAAALDEHDLIQRLRDGDERVFVALLDRYHASLVRLATVYVRDRADAEEVAQETWLGVLGGIHRFEGRSSLKTWIFHILVNCARTRAQRAARTVSLDALEEGDTWTAVEPERFLGPDHPRWPGHWASPPEQWAEEKLLTKETLEFVKAAIDALPPGQKQ